MRPRADRRSLLRYVTVAAIVLVVGGLFVQRELGPDWASNASSDDRQAGFVEQRTVGVGQPAPDFVLTSAADEENLIRLSDLQGKTVVLNFWATWCPPCRAEMPDLQEAYDARQDDDDLVVLGVNVKESGEQAQGFLDEFDLDFPVVLDRSGAVTEQYRVRGLPATFFIDADGVIRDQNYGPVFGDLLPEGIAAADAGGS